MQQQLYGPQGAASMTSNYGPPGPPCGVMGNLQGPQASMFNPFNAAPAAAGPHVQNLMMQAAAVGAAASAPGAASRQQQPYVPTSHHGRNPAAAVAAAAAVTAAEQQVSEGIGIWGHEDMGK